MWFRSLPFVVAFCIGSTVFAQKQVAVQVLSKETNEPVVAAFVHLIVEGQGKPEATVMTDEQGIAQVTVINFPAALEVTSIGFESMRLPVTEETTQLQFTLTKRFSALDEVVVTGLPAPVRLQDALSTYQVIGKAAMQAQGAVTVSDALKNQLNINMGNDGVLGSRTSMQGMRGDKVKILVDGIPLNGRENGEIDLGQINLNNVEKIEIVQGPMSVAYGTDALGGVINIITRKDNIPWRLEGGAYYESIGKYNFDAAGTYRVNNRHQFSLGGGRNFFEGWQPLDPLERSFAWKPKEQYLGNFAYNYTAKSSFRLQFAADFVQEKITNKDSNYTITPFYARAKDEYYHNTRLMTRLNLSGKMGENGAWQVQNGYNIYRRLRNRYIQDMVTLDKELSQERGVQDTSRFDDVVSRGTYSSKFSRVDYTIGYDINLQQGRSGKIPGGAEQINDYAGFLSATYGVLKDQLKFQPAVRYSYNTAYEAPVVPSLNVLYSPTEDWQFRASYAKGFRAPSLKELYLHFYDTNHEVEGNPDLKAEQGHHVQLSSSWTAYRKETNFVKLMITGFHNDVYNQISLYQPDTNRALYATYTNIDRMRNLIGSFQAEGQWNNLYLQLGYSLAHILNADAGVHATSQQATATVQYFWKKPGINLSTFYKYFGRQPMLQTTIDGGSSFNGVMNPYSFWDASVEKKFWKSRIQLIAGVKNILDVQNPVVSGAQAGGIHSGTMGGLSTGRSFFSSLRFSIQ